MFLNNWYQEILFMVRDDRSNPPNEACVDVVRVDGTTISIKPCYASSGSFSGYPFLTPMSLFNQKPDLHLNPSLFLLSNNTTIFYGSGGTSTYSPGYWGVVLGDGNTPESLSDYWLSGNQITDFTADTSVSTVNNGSGKVIGTLTYNIKNIGNSDFTIREFGGTHMGIGSSDSGRVMYYRKVLDTPLTITPNSIGTIRYNVEISAT